MIHDTLPWADTPLPSRSGLRRLTDMSAEPDARCDLHIIEINQARPSSCGPAAVIATALSPIFLFLALHRRRLRVFHFEPIGRAAGTVGGALALRDDAFEAKLAGVVEDGRAVALDMLIEPNAGRPVLASET